MNEETFMRSIRAGALMVLGEYRHSKAEVINWRDKTTQQAKSAPVLRHTVEVGDQSIAVSERVPDGIKVEDIVVPFKKGDSVVLHLEELSRNLGMVSARGRLEAFSNGQPGNGTPVGTKPGSSKPGS